MFTTTRRRLAVVTTEIVAIIGIGLVGSTLGPTPHAIASLEQPVVAHTVSAPRDVTFNSPWVIDASGQVAWALGSSRDGVGILARRELGTATITTTPTVLGETGATDARLLPVSGHIAFLATRQGAGARLVIVDPATRARVASYDLSATDTNPRGIGFNPTGSSVYIGANPGTSQIAKINATTGALVNTAAQVVAPTSSGIMFGTKFFTTVGTNPARLVSFKDTPPLALETTTGLIGINHGLFDPLLLGTVAWYGTDTTPGKLLGIDLSTRKIVANYSLGADTNGFRNLTAPDGAGFVYGTTVTGNSTQLLAIRLSDGARLSATTLGPITGATSVAIVGHYVDVTFSGSTALVRTTTASAPSAPTDLRVEEEDQRLVASWTPSVSEEPLVTYTATATHPEHSASCQTQQSSCAIDGLSNGLSYSVTVTAQSYAGSASSTSVEGSPATLPDPVSGVTGTRGDRTVTVDWTPQGNGGREFTEFRARLEPGGHLCTTLDTSCRFTGLSNGISYTATVIARTSRGDSPESAPSLPVTAATVPASPTDVSVTNRVGGATVSWSSHDDGGEAIVGYRVRVWSDVELLSERQVDSPSVTLEGLVHPAQYRVSIESVNVIGTSSSSVVWVSPSEPTPPVVPPPVTPEPPIVEPPVVEPPVVEPPVINPATRPDSPRRIVIRSMSKSTYSLGWLQPRDGGSPISDYRVMVRAHGSQQYTLLRDGVSPRRTVTVPRPPHNRPIYVRIASVNSIGESTIPTVVMVKSGRIYAMPRVAAVRASDSAAFTGLAARSTPYDGTSLAM